TASARNSALNLRRFDMKQILLTPVSIHHTGAPGDNTVNDMVADLMNNN
ncbi:hypothetical protein IWX78_002877, partial [Mycetocola sp. CAN_C7]